uniref:C-type lectin domain-containing protein n=1 Tax=Myripristis murdjan TaxID=586833 RepID=A0A667XY69_9TELE
MFTERGGSGCSSYRLVILCLGLLNVLLMLQYFFHSAVTTGESCGRCQPRWTLLNSSCYFFSNKNTDSQKNWPESRADCISRGGDLLVIDDWDEQVGKTREEKVCKT